jgi:hypothetical protein
MFLAFGAFFALAARDYSIGTAARMGPGFFPLLVGMAIGGFGAVLTARALAARASERTVLHAGPLAILIAALALFAALVEEAGLAAALVVLVLVSARAGADFHWREAIVWSAVLAAFSIATFVHLLGLPLRVWPAV